MQPAISLNIVGEIAARKKITQKSGRAPSAATDALMDLVGRDAVEPVTPLRAISLFLPLADVSSEEQEERIAAHLISSSLRIPSVELHY
jgi:hypothetical protein